MPFKIEIVVLEKHSIVMEITFENMRMQDWFENIFEELPKEICCLLLMSMRPKGENARHKFVFNLKDMINS
jgi:hypothetical protein